MRPPRSHGIACNHRKTDSAAAIGAESGGFAMAGPTEVLVQERDLDAARTLLESPPSAGYAGGLRLGERSLRHSDNERDA